MKRFNQLTLIFCGLLLLAAFPVFAQDSETVDKAETNRNSLRDFKKSVIEKIEKDKLDLMASFSLEGNAKKEKDSDEYVFSFTKTEGDKQMVEAAKDLVKVFGSSKYLGYFDKLDSDEINFKLTQDADRIYGNVSLTQQSKERARMLKNVFDLFLISTIAREQAKRNDSYNQDFPLLDKLEFDAKEKNLIINFDYQKFLVQELIRRELVKEQNKVGSQTLNSE